MFLSKKNAVYFNKPKNLNPLQPKRILNGWEDEEEDKKDRYDYAITKPEAKTPTSNLLLSEDFSDLTAEPLPKKETNNKFYLDWDALNDKSDIQCEKRLVEQIVQPGGIRIKPNDTMLSEFLKEIKGMEVHIIGSLLLSKIEVNYPFQTKAKALYTIDFLAKKNEVYLSYFKAHVEKLKEFPEPEDNVENYRKILKAVLNTIGVPLDSSSAQIEEYKPTFVDPGYNDDPKSQMSNFIQENVNTSKPKKSDNKKVIIGPGMAKQKQPVPPPESKPQNSDAEFFSLDLLGGSSQAQPTAGQNLLQGGQGQLSFEQMMGGINLSNNGSKQQSQANLNFLI